MSQHVAVPMQKNASPQQTIRASAMNRQCECGNHTLAGGECTECGKKHLALQRWPTDRPIAPSVQAFSRSEAEDAEEPAAPEAPSPEPMTPEVAPSTPEPAAPEPTATPEGAAPVPASFLVDDTATQAAPGQMRKSDFLDQLRPAVCAAADAALAPTGRSSAGCPYLDFWFSYYAQQDAPHSERALRRYAPEAAHATSAADYIPIVAQRVGQGVERWAVTGQITGLPEGIPLSLPASPAAAPASIQPMARPGGAHLPHQPQALQSQLGQGQPLDGGLRSRMESAFGASFGQVRVHNDAAASSLSSQVNARAFTVGQHVAFASGEYQPGTLVGDVLIAHELAHVVQQAGTQQSPAALSPGDASYNALEADADQAAVGAATSLWGGAKGALAGLVRNAIPSLRSGLRLQRCKSEPTPAPACSSANQSQRATAAIQPVVVAENDGSNPTSAPPLAAVSSIWPKCCMDFNVLSTRTVNASSLKTLDIRPPVGGAATAEETALFTAAGATSGIQIISVDRFFRDGVAGKNVAGGGKTYDAGAATPRIVVVSGVAPEVVAHEVGHATGYLGHDSNPTVMQPTGAHDVANPTAVSPDVCTRARSGSVLTVTSTSCCQNPT